MKFDELRTAWRDANAEAATPAARDELIAKACRRVERFWAVVFRRDMIETAAAVLVMYWFLPMAWSINATPLERVGAWVVVAGAVFIVYRLHAGRLGRPPAGLDAPTREFCRTELERLDTQIRLLRSVLVWYIGPIIGGLLLMSFGRFGLTSGFFVQSAVFLATAWGVHALNQYAVRNDLLPLRDEVSGLLRELEEPAEGRAGEEK